jgi:hypothetical protein
MQAEFDAKADEANKIRDELKKGNIGEQYQMEMDALTELHDAMLLTDEEFEQQRMKIKMKALGEYVEKSKVLLSAGKEMVGALQDSEVSKVEAAEQQKLAAVQERYNQGLIGEEEYNAEKQKIENDAAQQKLDIEKKYADVNFAIKVSEIIANTAMAIMQGYAQLGPIAGSVAAVMLGITGAMQVKAAAAERDKVKAMTIESASASSSPPQQRVVLPGIEEGGYIETERQQDGKKFSALIRKERGYVDQPTVLTGEAGEEFVANTDAVSNPTIKPVLDIINIAQRNGSVSMINLPKLVTSVSARGFESGGFTSTPTTTDNQTGAAAIANNAELLAVMKDTRDLLTYLKVNGVDAWVVLSQLQKQQSVLEKSQKLGSR